VKTPSLTRNKDSETAAGESTVCEEKGKGDKEDIESDKEGKEEDISAENRIDFEGEEEEPVECTVCTYPHDKPNQPTAKSVLINTKQIQGIGRNEQARCVQSSWFQKLR